MSDLILVHMKPAEVNALAMLQGGAHVDPELHVPNFEKACRMVMATPESREKFFGAMAAIAKKPRAELIRMDREANEAFDHKSKTTEAQTRDQAVDQIARKGRGGDKVLCLLTKACLEFGIRYLKEHDAAMDIRVNPETGLLELCPLVAPLIGGVALLGGYAIQKSGLNAQERIHRAHMARAQASHEEATRQTEASHKQQRELLDRSHAQERHLEEEAGKTLEEAKKRKEDYLKSVGYYDKKEVDHRPWRYVPNPAFNSSSAGFASPYVKEYFDPRTGLALTEEGSHKVRDEMNRKNPGGRYSFDAYVPTPEEARTRAINEMKRFGKPQMDADTLFKLKRGTISASEAFRRARGKYDADMASLTRFQPVKSEEQGKKTDEERILESSHAPLVDDFRKALARKYFGKSSEKRYAVGGMVTEQHSPGGILGKGTGQSDDIRATLPQGTYILPADVVSHLGDGSSSAGISALDRTFEDIAPREKIRKDIAARLAPVAVRVANEEYKIDPATVQRLGGGDLNKGSGKLDTFVKNVRHHARSNGLKLPPAAKDVREYF